MSNQQELLLVAGRNAGDERKVADRVTGLLWGPPDYWSLLPPATLEKGLAVLRELRRQAARNKELWQQHATSFSGAAL